MVSGRISRFWIAGLGGVISIGLSIYLIPREGPVGVAIAVAVAVAISCIHAMIAGRYAYPIPLPIAAGIRVAICCAMMAFVVIQLPDSGWVGTHSARHTWFRDLCACRRCHELAGYTGTRRTLREARYMAVRGFPRRRSVQEESVRSAYEIDRHAASAILNLCRRAQGRHRQAPGPVHKSYRARTNGGRLQRLAQCRCVD